MTEYNPEDIKCNHILEGPRANKKKDKNTHMDYRHRVIAAGKEQRKKKKKERRSK